MLSETQLTEIRNYLLSKKLPIDILIEVNDHFISQISDVQREENLSFEEAFEKTKLSWDKELKPYWRGNLNLEDISDFMVKTKKEIDKTNLFFALKYSTIPTLLIFFIALNFKAETFGYLTLSIVFGLTFYTLIKYFSNYQDFKLAKKYKKYVLTLHQHSVFIFLIIFSPLLNIYTRLIDNPEKYQKIITFQSDKPIFIEITFTFMSIYLIIFGVFYSLSAQKNYLKQIEKVEPFLKYL